MEIEVYSRNGGLELVPEWARLIELQPQQQRLPGGVVGAAGGDPQGDRGDGPGSEVKSCC